MRLLLSLLSLLGLSLLFLFGCQIQESTPSPRGLLYVATSDSAGMPLTGAKIYLNDVPQSQTTPAYIGPLAAGTYQMTLQLRHFKVDTDVITVTVGDTVKTTRTLNLAQTGSLTVTSEPSGAKILLNEEYLTDNQGQVVTTPATFTASVGLEAVSVVLSGYRTVSPSLQNPTVTPGDTVTVSFGLEQNTIGQSVSNLLPEFTRRLIDPDSINRDSLNTNQYRGHLVVYTCWFTTCVPCRAELPFFDRLFREFAPRGVRFVALTTPQPAQESYNSMLQAVHEVGISFPVVIDSNHSFWSSVVPPSYNGFPVNILVDTTGAIISNSGQVSEAQLRTLITSHLP